MCQYKETTRPSVSFLIDLFLLDSRTDTFTKVVDCFTLSQKAKYDFVISFDFHLEIPKEHFEIYLCLKGHYYLGHVLSFITV